MHSVTTTKTAVGQYTTSYESKDNEPPRVSSTSDYTSEVYSSAHPTPREFASPLSDYQSQLQQQQQKLYSDQHRLQKQQQTQLYQQQLRQQSLQELQVDRQPVYYPSSQPSLEQTRQTSTFMGAPDNLSSNRPLPFGSANSTRHHTLQSSMKKAASILPSMTTSKVNVAGTPTRMENMDHFAAEQRTANGLDRSSDSSSLRAQYGPPRFESSVQLTSGEKPNPIWARFLPNRDNADEYEGGRSAPAMYWCFAIMGGVCLLVLILLIVILIARMNVQREGTGGYGGGGFGGRSAY